MDMELFHESLESLNSLVDEYGTLQATLDQPQEDKPRLQII